MRATPRYGLAFCLAGAFLALSGFHALSFQPFTGPGYGGRLSPVIQPLELNAQQVCEEMANLIDDPRILEAKAKKLKDEYENSKQNVDKAKEAVNEYMKYTSPDREQFEHKYYSNLNNILKLQDDYGNKPSPELRSRLDAAVAVQDSLERERGKFDQEQRRLEDVWMKAGFAATAKYISYNTIYPCLEKRLAALRNGNTNVTGAGCFPGIEGDWEKTGDNVFAASYNLKVVGKTECSFLIASNLQRGGKLSGPAPHGTADLQQKKMESGLMGTYLIYRPEPGYRGTVNLTYTSSHLNLGHQETDILNIVIEVQ
jgi:hypothetical protein